MKARKLRIVAAIALLALAATRGAEAVPALPQAELHLFTDATLTTPGLTGSYVNQALMGYSPQNDWRQTQVIAGSRIDLTIDFQSLSWGSRAPLHLTGGSDANWENFSVQWDGYVQLVELTTDLATICDDAARMWIDLNHDGVFNPTGDEFNNNNWGAAQATTRGPIAGPIVPGAYRIRIQYYELSGGNVMRLVSFPLPAVRFAYLVPSNRTAQPGASDNLRRHASLMRTWFQKEMERNGVGSLTFRCEMEPDGVTPKVHVVAVPQTDDYLRQDPWGTVANAAASGGVPVWTESEVWVLVPEMHLQQPDGSVIGGVALGGGYGSGRDAGVAMVGSALISLNPEVALYDMRNYAGLVIPGVGPYPLVQDSSFPWFEETTISSVMSSFLGAMAHEMSHGFGISHDYRNDDNFLGNVMANGLRGIRGAIDPDFHRTNDTQLTKAVALALRHSKYFCPADLPAIELTKALRNPTTPQRPVVAPAALATSIRGGSLAGMEGDHRQPPVQLSAPGYVVEPRIASGVPPSVTILTSGTVSPVDGLLQVSFQASDDRGLSAALLLQDGNTIAEMPLSGPSTSNTFVTPYYTPGQSNQYQVLVVDTDGNRAGPFVMIAASPPANRAPQPFFHLTRSQPFLGETVTLNGNQTGDPDHSAANLLVEWDLDGNGSFDTAPTTTKTHTTQYNTPGDYLVRLRVTDPSGAQSISAPIAVHIRTSISDSEPEPEMLQFAPALHLAVSNPIRSGTLVEFGIPVPAHTRVDVLDVRGRLIRALVESQELVAGRHFVRWEGDDSRGLRVPGGVYFLRLNSGTVGVTRRLVVVR